MSKNSAAMSLQAIQRHSLTIDLRRCEDANLYSVHSGRGGEPCHLRVLAQKWLKQAEFLPSNVSTPHPTNVVRSANIDDIAAHAVSLAILFAGCTTNTAGRCLSSQVGERGYLVQWALSRGTFVRSNFYQRDLVAPGPITAALDIVSDRGRVEGWASYRDNLAVCHVQIRLNGIVLGEDMADKFRLDLLKAGLRYGHCAFYITIPITMPGHYPLELVDGRTGTLIDLGDPKETFIPAVSKKSNPEMDPALPLLSHSTWTDEQILAHLSCLQLRLNFDRMGAERFIDAVFRFALGRWADRAAMDGYCGPLCSAELTPDEVFEAVMNSRERKLQSRKLPSPFESDFPFDHNLILPRFHGHL